MRSSRDRIIGGLIVIFSIIGYVVGCTHDDTVTSSNGSNIVRGNEKVSLTSTKTSFDKVHSNVNWATPYLGAVSQLTGRFDNFGFYSFEFDESNAAGIHFQAWVWLNSVNTSEPARDDGCLLSTFGTRNGLTTEDSNLAVITSTSVALSTTDKGYNVKADLKFHGVTKQVSVKMNYVGKTVSGANTVYGFSIQFQMLAKTDFLITSNSIADAVDVKCNAQMNVTQ